MLYKYRHLVLIPLALFWLSLPIVAALLLPKLAPTFAMVGIGVWLLSGALLAGMTYYYQTEKPTQALSTKLLDPYTTQDKAELKALIKGGANPYADPTDIVYQKDSKPKEPYGKEGGDIMSLAIQYNDRDMVEFLLDNGYNINHFIRYTDKPYTWYNHTPLMIAICHNKTDITELLLRKGANRLAQTYEGETAIDMAAVKAQSLGTTTAYDFPQKPPTRYSEGAITSFMLLIWLPLVLMIPLIKSTIPVTLISPIAVVGVLSALVCFIVVMIYLYHNKMLLERFLSSYYFNKRISMPLIHGLHLMNKQGMNTLMEKAISQGDYPLVNDLLTRGISPKTYPKKDTRIQHLITHYPATVNALLRIKDSNLVLDALTDGERALLTNIALQKHTYEKTFSDWLKSFQTPTEPLLTDISLIDMKQVEICLQQSDKDAIIKAGQSIIQSLKKLDKPTTKQEEAIEALQPAASKLSQDEWKPLERKILRAFYTDKMLPNTMRPNNTNPNLSPQEKAIEEIFDNAREIIEWREKINEMSDKASKIVERSLGTLITRIQPKPHDGEAASSGDFSSSPPPLAEYTTGVSLNHSPAAPRY
jgi:hypothetical protein